MRTLEIVLSLAVLILAIRILFAPASRLAISIAAIVAVVGLWLQVIFEGAHWQLIPLYAACFTVLIYASRRKSSNRRTARFVGISCSLLVIASVVVSCLMPMFQLPPPTGKFAIGTRILSLVDQDRGETAGYSPSGKRELMIQAWYPVATPHQGPRHLASYQRFKELTAIASYRSVLKTHAYQDAAIQGGVHPLLLYNAGWQGERTESTFQMEDLASHGFIVVAIDHTFYGGKVEFPDGRVTDSRNAPVLGSFEHSTIAEQAALGSKFVHIEADDDIFVLNQLQQLNEDASSPFFHRIDLSKIGAMGFSIGGAVATQAAIQDKRIKAALNLDGWSFGDVQKVGLGKPLLNKPWMIIYEDKSQTVPAPAQLTSGSEAERNLWRFSQEDYDHVTAAMLGHDDYILFIAGANHANFTDRSLFSPIRRWTGRGTIAPTRAHQIINAYTLQFFSQALNGEQAPLLETSTGPFREVQIEKFRTN